jgi:GR25 family glycosyltransferase involved in LPS biosynthesis
MQVIVISLNYRSDRRKRVEKVLKLQSIKFSYVDAVSVPPKFEDEDVFKKVSISYLSKGSICCILSHLKTLYRIIESDTPYSIIFEDDVLFPGNFKLDLSRFLQRLPT